LFKETQQELGEAAGSCLVVYHVGQTAFTFLLQLILYVLKALFQNECISSCCHHLFTFIFLFCINENHKVQIILSKSRWVRWLSI